MSGNLDHRAGDGTREVEQLGRDKTVGDDGRLPDEDQCLPSILADEVSMTCRLGTDPAEIGYARELARKALAAWGLSDHAALAELVLTELATNALRHGVGPIDVALSYSGNDLLTAVHDHGASRPVRRQTSVDDEQGRGLLLIDGLIDLTGGALRVVDDTDGPGKAVYVTLSLGSGRPG